ncbi:MAG: sigma-70 family RNA polymerase sigma factor [Ruminococcaceae bacterium]|nr:sigma-70 family RNA polymerase sigma factor [Oscillospiraceae bacterium]
MGISFVENNKNLTDNEIISLINNGEYENLQIIIDRYLPLIIKMAKKYCPKTEVEDAVQEATIALYGAVKGYDSEKSSFSTLASVCIKRSMISHLRKNNAEKAVPEELIIPIEEANLLSFDNPESILIEKEDFDNLKQNIKLELSSMEYTVLQLFLEGKSYLEISKQMNTTEKSVDNALSRIRKKIQK